MKKIEAVIRSDRLGDVSEALSAIGVIGFSAIEGKGRGSGARPMLRGGRGTTQVRAEYNSIVNMFTLVEDSKVDSVVSAISGAAFSGNPGDGIIFVTNVEDIVNISSKKKGSAAL